MVISGRYTFCRHTITGRQADRDRKEDRQTETERRTDRQTGSKTDRQKQKAGRTDVETNISQDDDTVM